MRDPIWMRRAISSIPSRPVLSRLAACPGPARACFRAALAPSIGAAPGALHLRSESSGRSCLTQPKRSVCRRKPTSPKSQPRSMSRLRHLAETGLKAGRGVILDATYTKAEGRQALADLAAAAGVRLAGFWLEAPLDLLKKRVNERQGDASDATADVLVAQVQEDSGEITGIGSMLRGVRKNLRPKFGFD